MTPRSTPWLPRVAPLLFIKHRGARLKAALPYVQELYRPRTAKVSTPPTVGMPRAREIGSLLHLRYHSIPFEGSKHRMRWVVLGVLILVWSVATSLALKLRCISCACLYSLAESTFTLLERGCSYTTLSQFIGVILYAPLLLDGYGWLLEGQHSILYVAAFPVNVWVLELIIGLMIIWFHGHNVSWCYADYADAFAFGQARLGHAPAWLTLGWGCMRLYPMAVEWTDSLFLYQ
mmetsp:Transcript_43643/g.114702  ORF Transcript_43643/g.114702 Transcript_43643/m.114702 type:complete len:233 (+) Transcript_43643:35-733(+)